MRVVVEGPSEHAGAVIQTINQRRGTVIGSTEEDQLTRAEAEVPLAEMFGYATALRSATQGKAEFTMEFAKYALVPNAIEEELVAKAQEKANGGKASASSQKKKK